MARRKEFVDIHVPIDIRDEIKKRKKNKTYEEYFLEIWN